MQRQRTLSMDSHIEVMEGAAHVREEIEPVRKEKREHRRIAISELLYFSDHGRTQPLARMENISRGGLLFVTDQCLGSAWEVLRVDIYWGMSAYCLKDIRCRIVWGENKVYSDAPVKGCLVRGGLQFVDPTSLQRAQLDYLMIILGEDSKKGSLLKSG